MEKNGNFLLKLTRHFSQEKFNSIFPYFHHSQPLYDNLQEDDALDVDDWELIELLDQEFADDGDGDDMDLLADPHHFEGFQSFRHKVVNHRILSKDDIRQLLEDKVSRMSTVHLLSRSEAVALLIHFNWRVRRVQEEWLTRQENVRKDVGLFEKPVVHTSDTTEVECAFCFEDREAGDMTAISCGHQMCLGCWTEYIREAINDGPECLTLRCPEGICEAAVGIELIELVSNQDEKKKLHDYLVQSFVTRKSKAKWCPDQHCEYVVISSVVEDANDCVTCKCSHSFCWNCSNEAHEPIQCAIVGEWLSEIYVQSQNWVLAKARPCPNCDTMIEESSCIYYSRCTICDYVFLRDAFFESASVDEDATILGPDDDDDDDNASMRQLAKSSLERFGQYYLGWSLSEASRENAVTELKVLKELRLDNLSKNLQLPPTNLHFLAEAQMQVISCWRLLKWMHVYGYYVPKDEYLKTDLIEFMLEQAVKLVKMIEKHVDDFINGVLACDISLTEFPALRRNIIQLTRVTTTYYERLVEAMKADLSEVVSISRRASSSPKTNEASTSSPSTESTRKLIRTEGEEGGSSTVVNRSSEVLVPGGGSSSPREAVNECAFE